MAVDDPPRVRLVVAMAREARLIHLRDREFRRVADIVGTQRHGMLRARPVAGFAGMSLPLALGPCCRAVFRGVVRTFEQVVVNVFVTRLAGL